MKKVIYEITKNTPIANDVYLMNLAGDTSDITAPGQFVNFALEGKYLRRPISVCDYSEGLLTVIYKVVGEGTKQMAGMKAGEKLDTLIGLGNGYDMTLSGDTPLLIGGGVGVPPLYSLARQLKAQGKRPIAILGFNSEGDVFGEEEFSEFCDKVIITTADGSYGVKGFVTDAMADLSYSYFYTCGPEPMLKAIDGVAKSSGQFSFEERMGCGFGACMGCSCKTKYGNKRICKDGPVLVREEIIW